VIIIFKFSCQGKRRLRHQKNYNEVVRLCGHVVQDGKKIVITIVAVHLSTPVDSAVIVRGRYGAASAAEPDNDGIGATPRLCRSRLRRLRAAQRVLQFGGRVDKNTSAIPGRPIRSRNDAGEGGRDDADIRSRTISEVARRSSKDRGKDP
jgi:hypothetical protein